MVEIEFLKELDGKSEAMDHGQAERLLRTLAPFAPHIAEELWSRLGHRESIAYAAWPQADERYLVRDKVSYVIQVNGKVRGRVRAAEGSEREAVKHAARSEVASQLAGKEIVKVAFCAGGARQLRGEVNRVRWSRERGGGSPGGRARTPTAA